MSANPAPSPMQRTKIRVLFLASWYPDAFDDTSGIFIKRQAEAAALYDEIAVLYAVPDPTLKRGSFRIAHTHAGGVHETNVYYAKVKSSIPFWSPMLKVLRRVQAYKKGLAALQHTFGKPDLLHLHVVYPAGMALFFISALKQLPLCITEHWTGYLPSDGRYRGRFLKYFTRQVLKKSSAVITVSADLSEAMQHHRLPGTYYVVPNVVDTKIFHPAPSPPDKTVKRILHVSTLDNAQKNTAGILDATISLLKKRRDFELHIIGDGPDSSRLSDRCAGIPYAEKIIFHGKKTPGEVAQMMQKSAFLILFSNYETFSCVIAEAFASGLPVLSTRVEGLSKEITTARGMLVQPRDTSALEAAMNNMLDHLSAYDAHALSEFAEANFSPQTVGKKIHAIYSLVISKEY